MPISKEPEELAREKYWNEDYVQYWKSRVDEANNAQKQVSQMVAGDTLTSADQVYLDAIKLIEITPTDHLLEIGCGFGRSLNSLCETAQYVYATDISEQMINAAKQVCKKENVSFHVCPSESLPFSDGQFDVVICFAAFDAMYQTEALIEIGRVCHFGGKVLITGKNDNYHDDDAAALAAELGARNKGHPNFFTDVRKLVGEIEGFGYRIESARYFQRRGDFANGRAYTEMPDKFYEYLFVLEKTTECMITSDECISDRISRTFARQAHQA